MTTTIDRPSAIRRAFRDLVAERGFHGTSMGAIAETAGVATGTAYVHYDSKEELVYATYLEIKSELSSAVLTGLDTDAEPFDRFRHTWRAMYRHLADEPQRARFLTQLEESPYYEEAHTRLMERGDPLVDEAMRPDLAELLVPLPPPVLWSLSGGQAVRLVAGGVALDDAQLDLAVAACWRAITH